MKWLIIQSDGEHKGQDSWAPNWFLRECYSIQDALLRCGHTADIWGLRHANYHQHPNWEAYDYILIAENYETKWFPPTIHTTKRPVIIQWVIDLHCQPDAAYMECPAHIYLHATKALMPRLQALAPKAQHIWFPNAFDDRYFRPVERTKETDILFIGGGGSRQPVIDAMVRETGLVYKYGVTGYKYIEALRRTKIGFNVALNGDINYRTFETIAVGACLLTQYDPCLADLGFIDNVNCMMWHCIDQAVDQTRLLLKNDLWFELAYEGYQLSKQHTYEHRIRSLLKHL